MPELRQSIVTHLASTTRAAPTISLAEQESTSKALHCINVKGSTPNACKVGESAYDGSWLSYQMNSAPPDGRATNDDLPDGGTGFWMEVAGSRSRYRRITIISHDDMAAAPLATHGVFFSHDRSRAIQP
jgi:hypothetical protein